MKILCLVKQVPDSLEVRMTDAMTMERDFVAQVLNKADESAVELALRLRDAHGGTVTALSMGPARVEGTLRELLARGVDEGVLLSSPQCAGADTLSTARALAGAAKALGPFDLLIFGRRAADGETGQVGPMTAAMLGLPCVANALSARMQEESLDVQQLMEDGIVHWRCALPAALTLCEWSYPLRLPTLMGLRRAQSAVINRISPEEIGLTPGMIGLKGSATRVTRVNAQSSGVRPTRWIDADQAAALLEEARK